MNAPYSVRFASQIQKANSFDPANQGNELRALYGKMLKDKKNEEYLDQIYYALGNLERLNNNEKMSIEYYQKSIEKNIDNTIQLALTQKAMADLYFVKPDYVKSYLNYKAARMSFPQTHQAYTYVTGKVNMLEMLASNLAIVEREDSLQNIAKMPQAERDKMIDNLIAEVQKQKEEERKVEQNRQYYVQQSDMERYGIRDNATRQGTSSANSKWYFYNTAQVNQGLTEFNMRWGRRKLEDNWRRKNKGAFETNDFATVGNEQYGESQNDTTANATTQNTPTQPDLLPDQKQYYLRDLPLTPEAMQASNDKIMHSLYLVALAYKNDMKDNSRAISSFEELVKRFPNSEYIVSTYYNLFNLYTETGETANANKYKNLLSANYPDNILTLAILNPAYLKELERKEQSAENTYTLALNLYRENRNAEALNLINSVIDNNKNSSIIARLELLKVLATNYENNLAAYKEALGNVATTYKGTETEKTANEMLAILQKNEVKILADQSTDNIVQTPTQSEEYMPSDKEQYIAVIIDKEQNENMVAFEIILFNADYYIDKNYETNSEPFDSKHNIICVKTIDNKKDANTYYKELLAKSGLLKKLEGSEFVHFIISPENLQKLKQSKNIAEYVNFFKANYLK
jgi:tetratricopeptide (TPR) repeat protein